MLQQLSIKNFILIDSLDIEFGKGLNVFTGETGAGKSILLDALGLALGNRAELQFIQQGKESLAVCAVFSDCMKNKELQKLCSEYELEVDDDVIIKRTLNREGKGKIFFNDQPVSLKLLKDLTSTLVEINGQFSNQSLLNQKKHIDYLDMYGNYFDELMQTKSAFDEYKAAKSKLKAAQQELEKAKEDEELLHHFADELQKLNPVEGEENELTQRRQELMNAEKITENFNYAYQALCSKNDICSALRQAQTFVDRNNRILDDRYQNLQEMLENALINANDVVAELESISQNLNFDADEQNRIEERLFALKAAARKHNVSVDELPDVLKNLQEKLKNIQYGEDALTELAMTLQKSKSNYMQEAKKLSQKRKDAAKTLSEKVMSELSPLKMEKSVFVVKTSELKEDFWNEKGIDEVEFCVSTNPNAPLAGLEKIASGGELSRLMLAIKVNISETNAISTIVFDEIDSGIGGATAEAVGDRLLKLSKNTQTIVVTHSPQVAAKSSQHFKVCKDIDEISAKTTVYKLNLHEKEEEIARMISGENISQEAKAAAKVLIAS